MKDTETRYAISGKQYAASLPLCPVCKEAVGATFGFQPRCACTAKDFRAHIDRLEDFIEWQFEDDVDLAWADYDAWGERK